MQKAHQNMMQTEVSLEEEEDGNSRSQSRDLGGENPKNQGQI